MPLSATELLAHITRRLAARRPGERILAYWYCPDGPRKQYAAAISTESRDVVPLIVSGGFQVGNQLTVDLSNLIASHESEFEGRPCPTPERPLVLLLLSRDEFRLPQTASAARLPDWFPGLGGTEEPVWIEDLTQAATVVWDHPDVQHTELHDGVYRLDYAITRRLMEIQRIDKALADPWFQLVKDVYKSKPDSFASAIESGLKVLTAITNRGKYRMNLNPATHLTPLAAGVLLVGRTTPDQLTGVGKKLSDALDMATDPPDIHRPLTALLEETTNPTDKKNKAGRFGQTVLQAAYTAHRFYSVAAHTDEYPLYPFALVRSVCADTVRAVKSAAEAVEARLLSSS